jgi:hypothetical protein
MNKFIFPKVSWYLLLLIPFTFLGFYPSYFSRLLSPMDRIYHVHAFFMVLWVAMAIIQPFLIQQRKTKAHKFIGKCSYFIMPVVFITGYLVIRHTYYTDLARGLEKISNGISQLNPEEIRSQAAAAIDIGLVYFTWLFTFYLLAVINRKKILFHATYMFAAILTLLGPTVERLVYNTVTYLGIPYNFFVQNVVLFLILLLVAGLCIYQKRLGNSMKPGVVALTIYAAGISILFLLPGTHIWRLFVELIM